MAADRIVRRDFLNRTLLGAGAALLRMPAPVFAANTYTGYAGVGDYARSNGDPWPVVEVGHRIRDGKYAFGAHDTIDTGEQLDLIVLGAGLSGLGAAYYYRKAQGGSRRCLILENHATFGAAGILLRPERAAIAAANGGTRVRRNRQRPRRAERASERHRRPAAGKTRR